METSPRELETATPQQILAWAAETYWPRVGMTSSFGVDSPALLHMATRIEPNMPVILLDTGLLFPETLRYAEDLTRRLNLNLRVYRATPEQVAATRQRLLDPNNVTGACCDEVKVALMQEALADMDCWIAGLRRDQSRARGGTPVVQSLEGGVVKVHPLAAWTAERVHAYVVANDLPMHPLWYRGYTSIGCWPCTTPPVRGSDRRSGRWPGRHKSECGIHVLAGRAGS